MAGASEACNALLEQAEEAVGPFNIYDIYDDCPAGRRVARVPSATSRSAPCGRSTAAACTSAALSLTTSSRRHLM